MFKTLNQAERHRDLAQEYRHLAAFSFSTQMQNHYFQMAEPYSTQAEAIEPGAPSYVD